MAIQYSQLQNARLEDLKSNPELLNAYSKAYSGGSADPNSLLASYTSGQRNFESDKGFALKNIGYSNQTSGNVDAYGNFNNPNNPADLAEAQKRRGLAIQDIIDTNKKLTEWGIDVNTLPQYQQFSSRLGGLAQNAVGGDTSQMDVANKTALAEGARFQQALAQAKSLGTSAPTTMGQAKSTIQNTLSAPAQDTSYIDQLLAEDKGFQDIKTIYTDYINPVNQRTNLMDTYKQMYKDAGLEKLDEEIMDAKTIIEGTEDDIRNEIQMAGGFGTDSQVQALALSRNKSLLKNYNKLVEIRESKATQMNTMMDLAEKDRAYADAQMDKMLNYQMEMMNYRQKFIQNTLDQYNKYEPAQLYAMLQGNPRQLAFAEQIMGVGQGGLQRLATYQAPEVPLTEKEKLQNELLKAQIGTEKAQGAKYTAETKQAKATSTSSGISIDPNSPTYMSDLMSSTQGKKLPNQVETLRPIQKSIAVINQLSDLQKSVDKAVTDPVLGTLRKFNPYDFDARAIQSQLQAVVPNLARGVYGEVGVLTDQDIRNYIQTLPNLKSTKAQNDFVMSMTLKTVQRNLESQLETLASAGYDISGFKNQYTKVSDTVKNMEKNLGINSQGKVILEGKTSSGVGYKILQ